MIKAKELRLGNKVQKYGKTVTVDLGVLAKINNGSVVYEPIPLSEEWLLKIGFEKKAEHNFRKFIFERGIIHAYTNKPEVEIELGNKSGYSFGYPKVKSVHQLQNLVHSLTGEELTVKQEG
ncbi:hypothetical protein FY557_17385 [Chryseobacterium sp. SN22]|uniref:hypothetical protein n=1 Tax=Chryseobacterium sp. SN22 TaxID=2606431 RepID=UPI0011ED5738|nr:hypothetical protein [Chryseobacterium sp. SN22]KAA0126423.1 hypothetical protein FY557_17385 [Chryseobacterium sp. SN22]